ncbi:LLM class flavin-dependent oxidoreductase [Streptomyces sp. L7]
MAAYADEHGITTVQTEEHHGVANNWMPSPFAFAGAVFGATRHIAVTVSAVIGPLHDPLRLAEGHRRTGPVERRPAGDRRRDRLPPGGIRPVRRGVEATRQAPGRVAGRRS